MISGIPTISGNYSFEIGVMDTNSVATAKNLTLAVNTAPSITTTSLPNGTKNRPYSQTIIVNGGTQPLVFSISAGSLPTGLYLNQATGTISGTSTVKNTSSFTITATDANGVQTNRSYSIRIN